MGGLTADDFRIRTIATGFGWGEGPALLPSGEFVFSDVDNDTMWTCRPADTEARIFRKPSNHSNGNTIDHEGRLITCHHRSRSVTRTEQDGSITTLAESFAGHRLNSPNDVIVANDGSVWFTDPPYGILRKECGPGARQEQDAAGIYRLDMRTGQLDRMNGSLDKPNGLALSPNEDFLYVSDSGVSERPDGAHHIFRFELRNGGLSGPEIFKEINPGLCDGLRVDADGNVWSTSGDGIHCYAADGTELGRIAFGELTTNLCLLPDGMPRGFFVTAPSRVLICELIPTPASAGFCRPAALASRGK